MDAAGDWDAWFDQFAPALWLLARARTHTAGDADDALQEGFVQFWTRRTGTVRDPVAYLFACVRTAAIDLQRRRSRASPAEVDPDTLPQFRFSDAARDVELRELAGTVDAALRRLPGPQREALIMKVWGGLTFNQMGDALQISPNTAASRYRYAISALREVLALEAKGE